MAPPKPSQPGRAAAAVSRKRNKQLAGLNIDDDENDVLMEEAAQPSKPRRTRAHTRGKGADEDGDDDADKGKGKNNDDKLSEQEAAERSNTKPVPLPPKEIPSAALETLISCFFNDQCFTHHVTFAFRECGSIAAIQKLVDKYFQHEWQRVDLPDETIFVGLNCFAPKRSGDLDDEDAHTACRSEDAYQDWYQNIMESSVYLGDQAYIQVQLDTDAFLAADKERLKGRPSRADGSAEGPVDNTYGPRWVRKARTEYERTLTGVAEPMEWEHVQQGAELERERAGVMWSSYKIRQNVRKGVMYHEVVAENSELKKRSNEDRKRHDEVEKASAKENARFRAILREYDIKVRKG